MLRKNEINASATGAVHIRFRAVNVKTLFINSAFCNPVHVLLPAPWQTVHIIGGPPTVVLEDWIGRH